MIPSLIRPLGAVALQGTLLSTVHPRTVRATSGTTGGRIRTFTLHGRNHAQAYHPRTDPGGWPVR